MPELVATNLGKGRSWWRGFAEFVDDAERRKAVFGFERKGLTMMMAKVAEHGGGTWVRVPLRCLSTPAMRRGGDDWEPCSIERERST